MPLSSIVFICCYLAQSLPAMSLNYLNRFLLPFPSLVLQLKQKHQVISTHDEYMQISRIDPYTFFIVSIRKNNFYYIFQKLHKATYCLLKKKSEFLTLVVKMHNNTFWFVSLDGLAELLTISSVCTVDFFHPPSIYISMEILSILF